MVEGVSVILLCELKTLGRHSFRVSIGFYLIGILLHFLPFDFQQVSGCHNIGEEVCALILKFGE